MAIYSLPLRFFRCPKLPHNLKYLYVFEINNFYSCEKILVKLPNLSSIAINPQGDYKEAQGIKILTDFI